MQMSRHLSHAGVARFLPSFVSTSFATNVKRLFDLLGPARLIAIFQFGDNIEQERRRKTKTRCPLVLCFGRRIGRTRLNCTLTLLFLWTALSVRCTFNGIARVSLVKSFLYLVSCRRHKSGASTQTPIDTDVCQFQSSNNRPRRADRFCPILIG